MPAGVGEEAQGCYCVPGKGWRQVLGSAGESACTDLTCDKAMTMLKGVGTSHRAGRIGAAGSWVCSRRLACGVSRLASKHPRGVSKSCLALAGPREQKGGARQQGQRCPPRHLSQA